MDTTAPSFRITPKVRHLPIKRVFDLVFSLFVLVACFPFFLGVALLVKCFSKGPIFYSQERIGRGGVPFACYKFRTMNVGADQELPPEWKIERKLKRDPRITKIGHFLRKTSLDELPQFWNVVKGDLSVVGPRPVTREEIVEEYGPYASRLLTIRPGITGPWQVSGRSDSTYRERIRLDMQYIRHPSLLKDLLYIVKTIPAMVFSRGAY
jgi:undecaprenyl-phosphate galactose phosphotransferase